ncbi:hypothetical protein TVAG_403420 [Trichomonas vaginalis G3]|uniref:Spt20-like SEP domain-containing protein n=1 Tax=Trichomonas vaginalis (strain ATCC PRA-98 / G3) TaxID=412133 RepID=A2F8X8_TRIV3|nr:Spt20 family [Trichomonas vaginalis G3]EAX98660.1 hypothetical protein TVAG_403420 [Trichomonas vaginalis G3]KAI5508426.1 Spt20 family [Trichomonas vaginalis G3]|eukprot:XP_001311590.1 hypothetical protein [Trichomonas vaginalis G3]
MKDDEATQNSFIHENRNNLPGIEENFYSQTLQSLLLGVQRHKTQMQRNLQQGHSKNLGFLISIFHDDRFDMLNLPNKLFEDFNVSFNFEFHPKVFTLALGDGSNPRTFQYNTKSRELIRCSETGCISEELLQLFNTFGKIQWTDGSIIVRITDYRFEPQRTYTYPLTIGQDVILSFGAKALSEEEHLEAQKNILLVANPDLTLDPSPDVARINCVLDDRIKMWDSGPDKKENSSSFNQQPIIQSQPSSTPKKPISTIKLKKNPQPIYFPPTIFSIFTNTNQPLPPK